MPKAKAESVPAKKATVVRARKATVRKAATPAIARKPRAPRRSAAAAVAKVEPQLPPEVEALAPEESAAVPMEAAIEDAQSQVVASKFASVEPATAVTPTSAKTPAKAPRPTLPTSYGESHLLLLVRDPQTLFAAWDMSPATLDGLKGRLGRRGLAVSTLTLRLTRAGVGTSVIHVANHARSKYLKVEGGPSFTAEIGFTTPAGRFEFVARSGPCFVPMGPVPGSGAQRSVLGYREAVGVAQRGGLSAKPGTHATRPEEGPTTEGADSSGAASGPRVLGGASDLYRR